ncbi:MAG TPA: FGGY-family carbohydrate kinase, partial [Steroidobacteraceae bacterium]|nr:FGGY-family carbohydrate kinase [Steroidobacteraceae bacterium]
GMVGNELLMQFQADILDVPVVRPKITETTALGAAYAAGLAVGYWRNREDLVSNWAVDKRWKPQMSETRRSALYGSWQRAVGRSLDWME